MELSNIFDDLESSAPVGSSASISDGLVTIARAAATLASVHQTFHKVLI